MSILNPDTLAGAIEAGRQGKQSEWIQAHLALPYNKNDGLAEGLLAIKTRTYLGPMKVPLADLKRVCGPEEDMPFPEAEVAWKKRVNALLERLKTGWNPPPFIAAGGTEKPLASLQSSWA